jgi:hypothetical protein
MATEDSYFTTGAGRFFQDAAKLAKRGADADALAQQIIAGIRKHLHHSEGPVGLEDLAALAGVVSRPEILPFSVSGEQLEDMLIEHQQGDGVVGVPRAVLEARVVRRAWCRLQYSPNDLQPLRDLHQEYLLELARSVLLGHIEQWLGSDPSGRLNQTEAVETAVRRLLRGDHADIITSLMTDQSGSKVRRHAPGAKPTTEELLHEPLVALPKDRDFG